MKASSAARSTPCWPADLAYLKGVGRVVAGSKMVEHAPLVNTVDMIE